MNDIKQEIESRISILIKPLKSEEQIIEILKKRLTKKEYKLLQMVSTKTSIDSTCASLNIDTERYEAMNNILTKKLNQEKLKYEICS